MNGSLLSINVSPVMTMTVGRDTYTTGINKRPVAGRVALRGVNAEGDDQADRNAHGGADRALYAYAAEDYAWWNEQLGRALEPGTFGENLTVNGVAVSDAVVGERWRIGEGVELEVSSPRVPCYKLANKMGDPHFVREFARALRPGAYLRIIGEGTIGAGDAVTVAQRPSHGITIADVARIYFFERDRIAELRPARELGAGWIDWIAEHAG